MSFVVRQVTRSATGREIARTRRVEGDRLTIGRAPDNALHLADLTLDLHHAVLTRSSDHRVTLDRPATVVDLARGGTISLGDHRLRIGAGEGDEVLVTVEQAGAEPEPRDERRLFTLAGIAPGKRAMAWAFSLVILAAFVGWPLWSFMAPAAPRALAGAHADASWTPGPLSAAHAGLETNCKACHAKPFVAVEDKSCRACHATTHDHAAPSRLAIARATPPAGERLQLAVAHAFGRTQGRCADCHTEHQGATAMAPTPQHFCAECHGNLDSRLADTRLGDASDFGTAHPQFRPAVLVSPSPTPRFMRASLDARPKEQSGLTFSHRLHLSTTNAVAQMARRQGQAAHGLDCASCHTANGEGSFRAVSMEANCQSCHSLAFARSDGTVRTLRHGDPAGAIAELKDFYAAHSLVRPVGLADNGRRRPGDFAAASLRATYGRAVAGRAGDAARAARAIFQPGGACFGCHAAFPTATGYRIAPVALPQRYLLFGWFDHRAHASETCASCHPAAASTSARDVLIPGIATCRSCHAGADAHRGQVRSTCAMCHVYHQDPVGTPATDRKHRGLVAATGMPQVIRRGGE